MYVKLELRAMTDARQRGDDLLDHAVREIFLLRNPADVLKRQDRDRWLVGERQCRRPRFQRSLRDDPIDADRPRDVFEAVLADVGKLAGGAGDLGNPHPTILTPKSPCIRAPGAIRASPRQ